LNVVVVGDVIITAYALLLVDGCRTFILKFLRPLPAGHSGSLQHPQTWHAGLRQQGEVGGVAVPGLRLSGRTPRHTWAFQGERAGGLNRFVSLRTKPGSSTAT